VGISSSLHKSYDVEPEVRFSAGHGLILIAGESEHRVFNPSLEAMLQKYLDCSESRSSTRQWIEERNEYSPFSFAALCEYLELDADWLRLGLTRWMDNFDSLLDTTKSKETQTTDQSFKTRLLLHRSSFLRRGRLSSQPAPKIRGVTSRSHI
jgi:hypothetical protein